MRMNRSEAKIPPWDVGALNKHGPPVWPPPILRLRIRGKPRARDPVRSRAPARNKTPAMHLLWILVIRPPSMLWESYVRPPTESPPAQCIVTGNNYWETGTALGKSPPTHPPRHRASGCCTGEVWKERCEHEGTRSRWDEEEENRNQTTSGVSTAKRVAGIYLPLEVSMTEGACTKSESIAN